MPDLELTAAFGDYDRTNILKMGSVRPQGVNLRVLSLPPTEIFFRMCRYQEFDLSEMSMGAHMFLLGSEERAPSSGCPPFRAASSGIRWSTRTRMRASMRWPI